MLVKSSYKMKKYGECLFALSKIMNSFVNQNQNMQQLSYKVSPANDNHMKLMVCSADLAIEDLK